MRRVGNSSRVAFPAPVTRILGTDISIEMRLACIPQAEEEQAIDRFLAFPYRKEIQPAGKDVIGTNLSPSHSRTTFGAKSRPTRRPLPVDLTDFSPAGVRPEPHSENADGPVSSTNIIGPEDRPLAGTLPQAGRLVVIDLAPCDLFVPFKHLQRHLSFVAGRHEGGHVIDVCENPGSSQTRPSVGEEKAPTPKRRVGATAGNPDKLTEPSQMRAASFNSLGSCGSDVRCSELFVPSQSKCPGVPTESWHLCV